MSTRERWIVYPLLFLAIGFSLKFQLDPRVDQLRCDDLRVQQLHVGSAKIISLAAQDATLRSADFQFLRVVDRNQKQRIALGTIDYQEPPDNQTGQAGRLVVFADNGKPLLVAGATDGRLGQLSTWDRDGRRLIELGTTPFGGAIELLDAGQQTQVLVGHFGLDGQHLISRRITTPPPPSKDDAAERAD